MSECKHGKDGWTPCDACAAEYLSLFAPVDVAAAPPAGEGDAEPFDAQVMQNDPLILAREREIGSNQTEVSPQQRRAFRYGYEAAMQNGPAGTSHDSTVERDAARYRWMRDNGMPAFLRDIATEPSRGWDRAIDTAMAKESKA